MSNLPNWALGLLLLAVMVLFGVLRMGSGLALQPTVMNVRELASKSQEVTGFKGFYSALVAGVRSGGLIWGRFENADIPMHYHPQNEVIYTLQGQVTLKSADGSSSALGPGQLVILPARVAHAASGSGDFLLFATPPPNFQDTVWLEGPMAKPGAKADPTKKPQIIDAAQRIAQGLDQQREGLQFTVIFDSRSGSVELFRIEKGVALHKHPKENHVLYISKGRGRGQIGEATAEVGPGQLVVIPANVPHKLERIGDDPLDFILFSTPPFRAEDIVWLNP